MKLSQKLKISGVRNIIKKSLFSKNEIMQDKLQILHHNNEVKYKYILFDKWFSSIKN